MAPGGGSENDNENEDGGVSYRWSLLISEIYRTVKELRTPPTCHQILPWTHSVHDGSKQVWDNEQAPGRTWVVNGMGANVRTNEAPSAGGGRGKPMKMFLTPIVTFGFGIMRGYSPTNHQPYSSNAGWINPGYPMF